MILEFKQPIPVVTEDNLEGYALYVVNRGILENDEWCVVLCESGEIRHYLSNQIKVYFNATYGIKKLNNG
jgi:hypothetical protein